MIAVRVVSSCCRWLRSIAPLARIDVMGSRLDKAHDENQSLKRRITLLTGSSGPEGARHGHSKFVAEAEARANAEGILLQA